MPIVYTDDAMRHRYPQPGNDDEFEEFCVRFYRELLKRGGLFRYAKRGEKQDGIDIIDQHALTPFYAIQCKNHEPTKTISPREIKKEVSEAESSSHSIDHYIIATTAKKTKTAHDTVIKLNQAKSDSRQFTVEIHFWEDICGHLDKFSRAVSDLIVWGERAAPEFDEPVQYRASGYATADSAASDGVEDAELFPEIIALFEERKLEAAEHEISKLPDPEKNKTLSVRERYAILRLRAKLAMEQLQFDEVVRLFNLAYDTCPELQQARLNRVLALLFSGKQNQAHAEAVRLLDEGVRSPVLVGLLIRSANNPEEVSVHRDAISEFMLSEADVNLALVTKLLSWNQTALAQDAARIAFEIEPESAHVLFACGTVAHQAGMQGEWEYRFERLEESIRHYSDAATAAKRDNYAGLLPEIYTNRGRVRGSLGRHDKAAEDYRTAVTVSGNSSLYAKPAVAFFLHVQDYDSAWEMLPFLDDASDETAYLSAATEYHHAPSDEKKDIVREFIKLADRDFDRATEVRFLSVQWAIELRDFELAGLCVPDAFVKRLPFQGNTLLAWIALESGDPDAARELADIALESSSRTANQQELAVLARLLMRIGDDDKALPLLEHAATPGVLDIDCRQMLECAQRLDRHDTLLRICSELRETNQQDNLVRRLEVQLLSNYLPEEAFALATEFRDFDESYFSAARNFLAVRLGRPDEIEFDEESLPSPTAFSPSEAYLVVTPFIEVRRYRDAVDFTYHQLRSNFADDHAHGQYIWLVLQYCKKAESFLSPTEIVDEQSAVRLENLTTGEQRWLVIEDNQPDPARDETASSTPAAQSLIGKRIDDVVDLRGPSVQSQQERIIEIQTKYIRLFQNAMNNFQQRFPGAGTIQSIYVGSGEDFDPTPIIDSLKERRKHVEKVMAIYHDNLCSLHFLAEQLGVNQRQLVIGLNTRDNWFVRCAELSPQEFSVAVERGFGANKVVLDLSAIVTISQLQVWDHLDRDMEYFVSRATSDLIGGWLHKLTEQEGQTSAYSSVDDDGRMIIQEVTPQHLDDECDDVRSMVDRVRALCTVKDSATIADLAPKRREQYVELCGLHSLESVSVARDEDALLWTDDLFVALIGELDFDAKRVWTQLTFKILEHTGQLDSNVYSELTAKLSAWNYIATIWHPQDLIAAGNLCDWDANAWPLRQCIQLIGTCPLPLARKARLTIDFFRLLRRSNCIELKQSAVVQTALDAIGDARAVTWMLQRLDQFFQIDYPSAEFLKVELLYWLRMR